MFKKVKPEEEAAPVKARRKLTPAEKREIKRIMEAARGDGKPHSAQDTLPFRQMYPDGLFKLDDKTWSRCIEFEDVNYQLTRLDFQQEQGLVSALPLGINQIKIQRGLTTSSVPIFVPFISQELFQGGEALYYGLNATSGNMILADRKQLKTSNGLILGTPSSGKSFSAKREILNVFLVTTDDIIICDPEAEYFPTWSIAWAGRSLRYRRPAASM